MWSKAQLFLHIHMLNLAVDQLIRDIHREMVLEPKYLI